MGFLLWQEEKGRVTFLVISVLQPPLPPCCKLHTVATRDCESSNPPAEAAALIEPSAFLDTNTLRLDGDGWSVPLGTLAPHSFPSPHGLDLKSPRRPGRLGGTVGEAPVLRSLLGGDDQTLRKPASRLQEFSLFFFFFFFVCEDKRRPGSCVRLPISALRPPKKK